MVVVVVLALVAAALSALSAAGEQRAAYRLNRERTTARACSSAPVGAAFGESLRRVLHMTGLAAALLSSPLWLFSWAVDAASFGAQATALHLGSLSVVQPLMVSTLLFSVPLAALGIGRRATARDWLGAVAVSAGLALLLATRQAPGADTGARASLLPAMGAVVLLAMLLAAASRGRSASVRAALLASAAGALFSVGAATTKLTAATAATDGLSGLLTSWPGYALAGVSAVSFALQQGAYASGPLTAAMTAVIITDPLLSYALGVIGFGEPLPQPGAPLALAALGMIMLVAGVLVLARSRLLRPLDIDPPAIDPGDRQPVRDRPQAIAGSPALLTCD